MRKGTENAFQCTYRQELKYCFCLPDRFNLLIGAKKFQSRQRALTTSISASKA